VGMGVQVRVALGVNEGVKAIVLFGAGRFVLVRGTKGDGEKVGVLVPVRVGDNVKARV